MAENARKRELREDEDNNSRGMQQIWSVM